jgi:hypothetical protein
MNLRSHLYRFYNRKIFPKINHIRGSTRLNEKLKYIALNSLEKIEEGQAEPINSKEWDNLIILDACRHDIYEEVTGREVESRITVGSRSPEFIEKTFTDESWKETILIGSNPFYFNFLPGDRKGFFDLTDKTLNATFKETYNLIETDWDEEQNVVLPEKVVEKALKAEKEHPESRKIIHFMQPHTPHIPADYDLEGSIEQAIDEEKEKNTVWDKVKRGEIDKERAIQGYKDNLSYVLDEAINLAEELPGKTVITSDHGEFLGEEGFYGHDQYGTSAKQVRTVPWDEFN